MQQYDELDIPRFGPRAAPTPSFRMRRRQADGTRRMVVLAGGIGAVALLLIGGWSLLGHGGGPVPVIQADARPIRVKPEVRGGMQISGVNDDLLSGDPSKQPDALAAPTELPQTEQLRQLQQAELERSKATASAATMFAADPPPAIGSETAAQVTATGSDRQAPPEPAAGTPKPMARAVATPVPPTPPVASATPEAKQAVTEARPATTEAKPVEAARQAAGVTAVQLAAVGSEAEARQFWQRMTARMPELLAGRKPALTRISRDGRVFWRVRLDGFADTAAADNFCEQVHSKHGGCSVAAF